MLQVIEDIQADLSEGSLDERTIHKNPLHQFMKWLQEIEDLGVFPYPNAAMVSTASKNAAPSARVVLIKTYSNDGFVFYTNYGSRKGSDLNENPFAVLNFYWPIAEQQITITGSVKKVIDMEAEDYFRSRPRGSQIGAWASSQSDPVKSRAQLDELYEEYKEMFADQDVPRPQRWGGYRLIPSTYEFWMARQDRFHDRIRYTRDAEGKWVIQRIAP